jgi:ribosomal protein S18 acetylase RimI-like enzyme
MEDWIRYTLRDAQAEDHHLIYIIKANALREYAEATWGAWDDTHQRQRFDANFAHERFAIVVVNEEPVGFLETVVKPHHVRVHNIALVPEWRNLGIGTRLIIDLAGANGHREVRLRVLKTNPAKRFYERLGFKVVGDPDEHWWEMVRRAAVV